MVPPKVEASLEIGVSVIYIGIPVHDERDTIGPLLWRIRELLYGERREFHVIVVDDASTDGTQDVLEKYTRVLPMTLLRNESCQGYAATLERLVREAAASSGYPKRDALVTMQADFTDPPECVPEMLRRFEGGADLVTIAPVPRAAGPQRWARLGASILSRRIRIAEQPFDPYGSLRLYRLFTLGRALAETGDGAPLLSQKGWAANAELLVKTLPYIRRGEVIDPPPARVRRYRESRFQPIPQLRALMRARRDPAFRAAASKAREAAV